MCRDGRGVYLRRSGPRCPHRLRPNAIAAPVLTADPAPPCDGGPVWFVHERETFMADELPKNRPRRDFLGAALGGSAAAFAVALVYPLGRFLQPASRPVSGATSVGKIEDFAVGTAKTVLVNDHPVLVIRAPDGQFRAFSALCPHLQCVVGYSPERNRIECPCHRGVFSIDGQNVSGPPPRPLDEYPVTINDGAVIVSMG